jgi:hypothetical protein
LGFFFKTYEADHRVEDAQDIQAFGWQG